MWQAILGTAALTAILIAAGVVVYHAIYGCRHEYTKMVESGDITRKETDYPYYRYKVGKFYVKECSKCGDVKRFNCD